MPAKKKVAMKAEKPASQVTQTEPKAILPGPALPDNPRKIKVKSIFNTDYIITEDSNEARELYNQSRFGALEEGNVHLSLIEAYFLIEKERLIILDGKNRPISKTAYLKKAKKIVPKFLVKYVVYRDMRNRGYIVKTALKFGADYRIYDRGVKPGDDHAKWVLYPVHESECLTWHDFAAKNRVAHSTKKRLLIGIVDEELDVTYYEIRWLRP